MNKEQFLNSILDHFNEEELKTLCFNLTPKVDYESLAALGKAGKARELVTYCARNGMLDELIKECRRERPKANWPVYSEQLQIPSFNKHQQSGGENRLKVFLCHASGDKEEVRELYHRLKADGFIPWLDEEDLLPGQDWKLEIPKAVRSSDVVLVCLSENAITKRGYVQREIRIALDEAEEVPEGTIYLIPARLDHCTIPEGLRKWQWVNLFETGGYEKLKIALELQKKAFPLLNPDPAKLRFTRENRFIGSARTFIVHIKGATETSVQIARGERKTIEIPPGEYEIHLETTHLSSNRVGFSEKITEVSSSIAKQINSGQYYFFYLSIGNNGLFATKPKIEET